MNLDDLAKLNAKIAARQAVAHIVNLESGEDLVLTPQDLEGEWKGHYAAAEIRDAFRSGKSGIVDAGGQRFFLTVYVPPVKLVIIGAVHISQALAEIAGIAGLDCTIIDPRTAFASEVRFPGAKLIAEWPDVALPGVHLDAYTAFAALTHDPKIDDPALLHALEKGCFYIGALGSRKTHAKRLERLEAAGGRGLDRIRAPIGLDIGAISPQEIAVSILAEIIAAMRKGSA